MCNNKQTTEHEATKAATSDAVREAAYKIDIDAVLHRELVSQIRIFEEHKEPLTAQQLVAEVPTEKLINLAKFAVKYYEAAPRNTQGVPIDVYAELIYLRYCHSIGAAGADWNAVECKDVWREKAILDQHEKVRNPNNGGG